MVNFKNLISVNDIFFISEDLKKINKNFKLFFNTLHSRYEIHDISKHNSFVLSYNRYPDRKLITKLYQTKKENMVKLFQEIEKHNEKLEIDKQNKLIDESKQKLNEFVKFTFSNPSTSINSKLLKNILDKGD